MISKRMHKAIDNIQGLGTKNKVFILIVSQLDISLFKIINEAYNKH